LQKIDLGLDPAFVCLKKRGRDHKPSGVAQVREQKFDLPPRLQTLSTRWSSNAARIDGFLSLTVLNRLVVWFGPKGLAFPA
jgi:hypothetical protein